MAGPCQPKVGVRNPDGSKDEVTFDELDELRGDAQEEPELWVEDASERVTSEVVVEDEESGASITVERIESMVMERQATGERMRWQFDHTGMADQ